MVPNANNGQKEQVGSENFFFFLASLLFSRYVLVLDFSCCIPWFLHRWRRKKARAIMLSVHRLWVAAEWTSGGKRRTGERQRH